MDRQRLCLAPDDLCSLGRRLGNVMNMRCLLFDITDLRKDSIQPGPSDFLLRSLLCSAQSPVGEGCRPALSTVSSKATLHPVAHSVRSRQCSEPATQTFVQRLKNEVKGTVPVSSISLWRICHKLTLFGCASRMCIALLYISART